MTQELSTYKIETAVNILRKYGLKVTQADVAKQFDDEKSFYRLILRLPAQLLQCYLILQQIEDMQNYVQSRLMALVFANYTVAMKQGKVNEESSDSLSGQMLNELQTAFEQQAEKLNDHRLKYQSAESMTDNFCREQVQVWKTSSSPDTIKQVITPEINQRIPKLEDLHAVYEESLKNIIYLDQKISIYMARYPDSMRERELEKAEKIDRPAIDVQQQ